jgi:RNA polymerase sigma-70 factor (ECF subfamily)
MSNQPEAKSHDSGDDRRLVAACQKGDVEAFGILVERYQKKMLNVAWRMIGDYDAACETVQETFLAAYRAIGKFRGDAEFSTWLYEICLNRAKNRLKQEKALSSRRGPSLDDPVAMGEGGNLRRETSGGDPLPDEQFEKKEIQGKVQGCIQALDAEYREVLILRDIQGMSYEEIGGILHLPEGTVKSRLFRARDALKDRLKKVFGELP